MVVIRKEETILKKQLKQNILFLAIITFLCGIIYPTIVTAFARIFFPKTAKGNLVQKDGQLVGSFYVSQSFSEDKYFWGRPTNEEEITKRIKRLTETSDLEDIPQDLITISASKQDPDIRTEAAYFQVERIANNRKMEKEKIEKIIKENTKNPGVLGEKVVNVLQLNLALEEEEKNE